MRIIRELLQKKLPSTDSVSKIYILFLKGVS